ncbi:hypothetical protein [Paenibacillus azoreducens]|uniref:Uncharacterized protein n=1 Tax=Paenibacillus azoreducens TaxID=116718 RepID=A0A920CV35_9BACL|nr:hypothetical protein [Paenibacillus azoreducens]GIO50023.1 hypothetical protein J34TS1_47880 [Paenibacillus azoreducens]
MSGEFALRLLKDELRDQEFEVEQFSQRKVDVMVTTVAKMRNQIYDLKFAIELLEEYQD